MSLARAHRSGLVVIACLAFAVPALAKHPVPFKASLDAQVTSQSQQPLPPDDADDGNHPILETQAVATGNATHLGKVTAELDFDILLPTMPTEPIAFDGTIDFKAANGDHLYADFSGVYISQTEFVGTLTFTGGTGRFAGASGSGTLIGEDTNGPLVFTVDIDGIISY